MSHARRAPRKSLPHPLGEIEGEGRKEGGGYHTFVQNNWPIYIVVGRAGAGGVHVYSSPRPICARGEDNPICVAPHNRNMTMCEWEV